VDYLTGERAALPATIEDGTLVVDVPRKDAPVLYLAIS
jgi:hypothetical protein